MNRKAVLSAYRSLIRITKKTFEGDTRAISEARKKINLEFRKETKDDELEEKLKIAKEVGQILEKQVVQAVKAPESDKFELKLRKETLKLDNTIFKEDAILPEFKGKKCKPEKT